MAVMIEPRDDKMDALSGQVAELGGRIAVLAARLDGLHTKVDERFQQVDKRFEQVDKRFERVEGELLEQRREIRSGFERMQWTVFGAAVTIIAALIGVSQF